MQIHPKKKSLPKKTKSTPKKKKKKGKINAKRIIFKFYNNWMIYLLFFFGEFQLDDLLY